MMLTHLHDEASMRIRSYVEHADEGLVVPCGSRRIARGRGSKVQNNAMWAWFGNEGTEVFLELQPLMRKDVVTLTHALVQTVGYAADASVSKRSAPAPPPLRLLHLLSRDGIATNMAAARRLLHHVSQQGSLQYRLLVWSCASHQAI
jgi:hypothetical protein